MTTPDRRDERRRGGLAGDLIRRGPDLLGPLVCNVAGGLAVMAAWVATSGQAGFGPQLPYLNLGAAGVILAGGGDVAFLLGYRRLIRQRIAQVARSIPVASMPMPPLVAACDRLDAHAIAACPRREPRP